jgi:cell division protease FtsH
MNSTVKAIVFWMVILFAALALWQVVKNSGSAQRAPEISYSQFLSKADSGDIVRVRISKVRATGIYRDGSSFRVVLPSSQEQMLQLLREQNVEIWYADAADESPWSWLVNLFAPLILLAALWFFMIRQMRTRANLDRAHASVSADISQGS